MEQREIKFRGYSVDDSEWIYGDLLTYRVFPVIFDKNKEQHEVDARSVGQYTGLKDKNGTEIYEGDVVKMHQFLFDGTEVEREHIGTVSFNNETACFEYTKIKGGFYEKYTGYDEGEGNSPICLFFGLHEESFEIIGNIYEHPSFN